MFVSVAGLLLAATVPWVGPFAGSAAAAPAPTRWSDVQAPVLQGARGGSLYGVACPAPDECIAVGAYALAGKNSYNKTLIEAWDGNRWSVVPAPRWQARATLNLMP